MSKEKIGIPKKNAEKATNFAKLRLILSAKIGLRYYLTLSTLITLTLFGAVILATSFDILKEHKSRDTWSIFFLDMESRARYLSEQLVPQVKIKDLIDQEKGSCSVDGLSDQGISIYEIEPNSSLRLVKGNDLHISQLDEFSVIRHAELASWNLLIKGDRILSALLLPQAKTSEPGESFLVRRIAVGPFTWKIDTGIEKNASSATLIYIVSRQGKLIFSSNKEVNEGNFLNRQLVQKFIELPIWQGLLDIVDGTALYGFFMEIPHTNLVIFAETSQERVIAQVHDATKNLIFAVVGYALLFVLILYAILSRLLAPISNISQLSLNVAKGNFDVNASISGFGEVRNLTESFKIMIDGLKERDNTIKLLAIEQVEKVRLAAEMAVAKQIQESLLSDAPIPQEAGITISAVYHPAGEVAGDWYSYFYSHERKEAVIAIVDVSGHGAGSSMFTTIAAAMFEEFRLGYDTHPNPKTFFVRLNNQFIRYGKLAWSATAQMLIFSKDNNRLNFFNAAHPAPIWLPDPRGVKFASVHDLQSDLLGMSVEISIAQKSHTFLPGQSCMIYTDGLSEMRSPERKILGTKRLINNLNAANSPEQMVAKSLALSEKHANGHPQEDDICIIALKAV